ncbi:MAG TPA: ABC transporter permease [Acidimicrobiia bacterium]|jgi:peptide/nickel transport system permease protein
MRMIVTKLIQLVVVLLVVSFLSFMLINLLPGDPAEVIIPFGTPQARAQLRHDIGTDKPLPQQYAHWLNNVLHGNLGQDYQTHQQASTIIKQALPKSLQLLFYAEVLALLIAIPLGVFSAYRAGSVADRIANLTVFGLLSVPDFILLFLLTYYLGVKNRVFPVIYPTNTSGVSGWFKAWFLPAASLAAGQLAVYMRLLRTDMIATLQEDYITMAKSKGLTNGRILWRHALRPSSFSLLTATGLSVGALIGGAFIVEVIYSIPGMGLTLFNAISQRQYVLLQACVLVIAVGYVLINFVVDILYSVLDPRIRHARAAA